MCFYLQQHINSETGSQISVVLFGYIPFQEHRKRKLTIYSIVVERESLLFCSWSVDDDVIDYESNGCGANSGGSCVCVFVQRVIKIRKEIRLQKLAAVNKYVKQISVIF